MSKGTIILAVKEKSVQKSLEKDLAGEFGSIVTVSDPALIPSVLRKRDVDVIMLGADFRSAVPNGNEGFYWMKEILDADPDVSIIILSSSGDVDTAVRAIRGGAADFIRIPCEPERIIASVTSALKLRNSRLETSTLKKANQFLRHEMNRGGEKLLKGASPTMISVMNIVGKVAATGANVLITGENGTGKELIAKEIHGLSERADQLMLTVDMGSVTESLFESELFGHVKGAFTDAREDRKGKFEQADGGTLFLDEIGNLSPSMQAKLLTVLQSRQVTRVGSNKPLPIDIRLICATNRNLGEMVRDGLFREDLLYRINTIVIEVPPLRDRVDDIPILASHFMRINAAKYGKGPMKITTAALEKLSNHDWPGNVRELQHAMEKAVILSDSDQLKPSDFIFAHPVSKSIHTGMTLEEMEKRMISECLRRYGHNMTLVADKLGVSRQTLYNKIARYGL